MFDDVLHLPGSRFHLSSEDPSFRVTWRGGARFLLSGEVSNDPSSELDVETPSGSFEVPLATHSRPAHAVAMLKRSLPRDVLLVSRESEAGVEVHLEELVVPAARPPRLRIFTTDLAQRVAQLDENKVEFRGAVGGDGHLTVLCDGKRVTLALSAGHSAALTATRVGSSMPRGYRALIDGATVSVWKDAEFFEAVA